MFLEFYMLREQPFGVTPDTRFLCFGSTHREALASLLYAIESKRGFSALVTEGCAIASSITDSIAFRPVEIDCVITR
jgi:type II secretory pathway predicted ATPase ExeA